MEFSLKNSCYVNADLRDHADESQVFEGIQISSDQAVDEVDFARVLSPRLLGLDFSKIEVSHEEEACKKIKRAVTNMGRCHYNLISVSNSHCYKSLLAALEPEPEDEKELFWQKVEERERQLDTGRLEAAVDVNIDEIVKEAGADSTKALLSLLKDPKLKEFCIELFVIRLLDRKASVNDTSRGNTSPLHLAAKQGFTNIGKYLIKRGASLEHKDKDGKTPLEIAIEGQHNDFSIMLIQAMDPESVRKLFKSQGSKKLCSIEEVPGMKDTLLAVLDTMIEPIPGKKDTFRFYYEILEEDSQGKTPNDDQFQKCNKSFLYKISRSGNKDVIYHDVVRFFIQRKWKKFARKMFILQCLSFLLLMVTLTCALTLAAKKLDPRQYHTPLDIFRGVCEGLSILFITYNGIAEINQLRSIKLDYLKDIFNYTDILSVLLVYLIIPFRVIGLNVQWVFASLCYLLNGLRAMKYAAILKSTGAYVQILYNMMHQVMFQFSTIFFIFLISFSGAFYFALRGEMRLSVAPLSCGNSSECSLLINGTNETEMIGGVETNLNLNPYETGELYHVWLTGIRVMIEGGTIVDEYFGPAGFMWLGVIIYLTFLFLVIVVLLNLLIAQMSDTYTNVQQDAQRSLVLSWGWIVAKMEHHSMLYKVMNLRRECYKDHEDIENPKDILEENESPQIGTDRKLEHIMQALKKHEEVLEDLRSTLMEKKKHCQP